MWWVDALVKLKYNSSNLNFICKFEVQKQLAMPRIRLKYYEVEEIAVGDIQDSSENLQITQPTVILVLYYL